MVTPLARGNTGSDLSLLCSVTYQANEQLMDAMPVISWSTYLTKVNISDQSSIIGDGGRLAALQLNLNRVNSSYSGMYVCSVMDRYSDMLTTSNATVVVNTGMLMFV